MPEKYANGYPIKLVRDAIGERLGGEGTITYEPINDEATHIALLRRKLIEEAVEYLTDPSVGELADVLEVVWSLAVVDLRAPFEVVEQRAKTKRIERGGFKRGVAMVGHHEAAVPNDRSKGGDTMNVTDEMIEAACIAQGGPGWRGYDASLQIDVRAGLEAALAVAGCSEAVAAASGLDDPAAPAAPSEETR
jgi:predicted house-cleaning noncanonical NTP pyrophosphatase (MazG superfamily)